MAHWKFAGFQNSSPSFAGYAFGTTKDFTLTFVNDLGKTLEGAYVFVDSEYMGYLQVKLPTESDGDYRPVSVRLDGLGHVGDIPEGDFDINFRLLNNEDDTIRMHKIRVFLGYNDDAMNGASDFFWHYLDLDDYLYEWDESGKWLGPGGASTSDLRLGYESDWWYWADCEENQNYWNNESPINRKPCARQLANLDSFDTTGDTTPVSEDGSATPFIE